MPTYPDNSLGQTTHPGTRSVADHILQHILQSIARAGGWVGFDDLMQMALYTPELGYYARHDAQFGPLPYASRTVNGGQRATGSDFVTAPELSPLFGQTLARQVLQALQVTGTVDIWEFGAGTGVLALQILQTLQAQGVTLPRYHIVDVSGSLRTRQQATLAPFVHQVRWMSSLPDALEGVVLGNEVLDAMPVKLLVRMGGIWHERGVTVGGTADAPALAWQDRPTTLRPPRTIDGSHDYLTEIHPQSQAFVRTLADKLVRGAMFWVDYGYVQSEYYHPQRAMGTVMCHRAHQADADPLVDVGHKDITAHVDFSGLALAATGAGLGILGFCTQAHFLINCGLADRLQEADLAARVMAQKLIMEHEMGELFKVIGFYKGPPWQAMGFARGDRTHRL